MTMHRNLSPKEKVIEAALNDPFKAIHAFGDLSLFEFLGVFWNEISDDEYKPNWHIEYLCGELEKLAQRVGDNLPKEHDVIINIPPGTTKTIICSVMFPVWCWTRWPWIRLITGSYSDSLALESAEKSRDIMRCDKFKMLYPNITIKQDKDTKSNYKVAFKQTDAQGRTRLVPGGMRYSTSVGGTLTGYHGHILIWDDPINPAQAVSDVLVRKINTWVDQTASTRKTDKNVSVVVLVMQRLHQEDPSGYLLDKENKKIKHICLPGEIRNYRDRVSPPELIANYKDDLLDTVRLNWDALRELETDLGQYGYAGQIGQNPVPPGGGMFKVAHIPTIQTMPNEVHIVNTVRYWDKAATVGGGAFTVGVKMCRLRNGVFVIMDVKRGQLGTNEREKIIKETAIADGRQCAIYVEQEPGSGGKESAENTIRALAGFVCYADRPTGDKIFRADPYSVQVNNGNVHMLQGLWNKDYLEELRNFPFGKFKDQVDASSGAFNMCVAKRIARRIT